MRLSVAVAAVCLSIVGLAVADDVRAAIRKPTSIPAEGLVPALKQLAHERNLQVVFQSEIVGATQTHGAVGELTTQEALNQLLEGTNLIYRFIDEKTITILPASAAAGSGAPASQPPSSPPPTSGSQKEAATSGPFLLAQAAVGQGTSASSIEREEKRTATSEGPIQEVIVTAQKREERLQDVPVPVTAIDAQSLVQDNQLRLQDYYTSVPGMTVAMSVYGNPELIIRGIATGADLNPSVGVTVDDVPYGSTTALGGGSVVPDLDPSDLQRVEVLRGPQGTLYGANSLGGLFKFVTIDPSTSEVSGRLEATGLGVKNGNEFGYGFRGAANVPVSDTVAIRVSGFARQDPGYVDDIETGQKGVNEERSEGARFSALWKPSDVFSLKLNALFQDARRFGSPDVNIGSSYGDLEQQMLLDTGRFDRRYQIYSAILKAQLGPGELTAISGYSINRLSDSVDYSEFPFFDSLAQQGFGVSALAFTEDNQTHKFSQELRYALPLGARVDWLLGVFYTHEGSTHLLQELAEDPSTAAVAGGAASFNFPTTYQEYAAFTDVTMRLTDRFDVQIGGRESWNRQTYSEVDTGPFIPIYFGGPAPFVFPEVVTRDNAFTYLFTPRYKLTSDLMAYARIASGYRPGGPNSEASVFGLPDHFNPDKTNNYELGVKGDMLQHRLTYDLSAYYIKWKDIQLVVVDPSNGDAFTSNAGGAKSQGLELAVTAKPFTQTTLSAWTSWDQAVLTQPIPSTGAYGVPGDRLPYTPRFSANASVEQDVPLRDDLTGFLGGTVSYVGYRLSEFQYAPPSVTPRAVLPAYARLDLRAGVKSGPWVVNLFANNVTDRRGELQNTGTLPDGSIRVNYIEPREIGLSVSKTFSP